MAHIFILLFTVIFFLAFFLERRTMWIGILFAAWIGFLSIYIIVFFETIDNPNALRIVLFLVVLLLVGLPFYLISFIWLLISSGIRLIKREGRRMRNFLSVALGLFIIGWFIYSLFLRVPTHQPLLFFITNSITISVYYFFVLMAIFALASMLNRLPIPFKKYDYIIVLGSGLIGNKVPPLLASRINKGIECFYRSYRENHPVKVIFTGGQGSDELLPEGVAMANYAMEKGLAKEHIIIEDKAVNTYENLLFSKQLIEKDRAEKGIEGKYNVLTVTNNFHVFRALLWARKVGVKSDGAGSKTKFYFWLNALIREFIGVVFMHKKFHMMVLIAGYVLILLTLLLNKYVMIPNDLPPWR